MKVVLVLRTLDLESKGKHRLGGQYSLAHVERLVNQLDRVTPGLEVECLTDVESQPWELTRRVTFDRLWSQWPGWWAKMEMCRPDIHGPILYIDLDTTILLDLALLIQQQDRSIVLSEFMRPERMQSAFMLLTEADRALVWDEFRTNELEWLTMRGGCGDQEVFDKVLRDRDRWQDIFPGAFLSYKVHDLGSTYPPPDAHVVIFHGDPKPWEVEEPWA